MESLKTIENILEYGNKDTTYKYALLVSIVDYLIEFPNVQATNNLHMIPTWYIVKKFISYYYPLINAGVPQGPKREGRNTIAFETFFNNLKQEKLE